MDGKRCQVLLESKVSEREDSFLRPPFNETGLSRYPHGFQQPLLFSLLPNVP